MSKTLMISVVAITLALIFYTVGVWREHRRKLLKIQDVVCFLLGLSMDITGTSLMSRMAEESEEVKGAVLSLHGITGLVAILLMIFHVVWAVIVLIRNKEDEKASFHRFSLFVWGIWLIPYFLGMAMGMM